MDEKIVLNRDVEDEPTVESTNCLHKEVKEFEGEGLREEARYKFRIDGDDSYELRSVSIVRESDGELLHHRIIENTLQIHENDTLDIKYQSEVYYQNGKERKVLSIG